MIRGQHLIGKTLGSCVLERLLGYGGSSAVFLAQQQAPDIKVAVKVFLPRTTMDKQMQHDFYARFLHEADVASKLNHPNILPIYAYGEQDGLPYIVMPYMSGGTLSEYATRRGPFSLQEALWYLDQIATALDYAHEHGFIHCDVKPANILLDSEGHAILSDFGIARMTSPVDYAGSEIAKAPESLMGTPDYISPEQALGQSLDGRTDIYSLGILLFFLLAKQLPFKADSTIALALLHVHEPPPSLALLRVDISPSLDRVIRKALAKKAEERFQTARAFSAAFARAIEASEALETSEPPEPAEPISTPSVKKVRLASSGAASVKSEPEPLLIGLKPTVRVKPVLKRPARGSRFVVISALLSIFLVGVLIAAGFVSTHLISGHASATVPTPLSKGTKPLGTNTSAALTDQLVNTDDWPVSSTFFYSNQQYHIRNTSQDNVALALYAEHPYSNFYLTITMHEVQRIRDGADYYGIVFRSTSDQLHYYLFEIMTSGSGQYVFWRYDGQWKTLAAGPTPSLQTDPQKSNVVSIEAHNNTFKFTINQQSVGAPFTDTSTPNLASGAIGLYVEDKGAEVAFSHLFISTMK
jgi:serine/threonine protein kinase